MTELLDWVAVWHEDDGWHAACGPHTFGPQPSLGALVGVVDEAFDAMGVALQVELAMVTK
jgi:hypothetical protein